MKWKKNHIVSLLLNFLVIALIVVVVTVPMQACLTKIRQELESQTELTLRDVTSQNAYILEREFRARLNLLQVLSQRLPEDDVGLEEELREIDNLKELYQFKRVGFVYPDGIAYTSDDSRLDLSFREFFIQGMQGRSCFSDILKDLFDPNSGEINVMSLPVYNHQDGSVRGVLFATYETAFIRNVLSIDSFDGNGVSCILDGDGKVLIGSKEAMLPEYASIFDVLGSYGQINRASRSHLRSDLDKQRSGFITFTTDRAYYMYYQPISVMDGNVQWYLSTVVPTDVLNERMTEIHANVQQIAMILLTCMLMVLVLYLLSYRSSHKQLMRLAYIDPITNHENYTAFREKMRERHDPGFFVSLDLAEFKIINNTCGFKKGDLLLREIWNVLEEMLNEHELGCHISGDHFVLFMKGPSEEDIVRRILDCNEKLCALSEKMGIPHVVPKFGIYAVSDPSHPEEAYGRANQAKKRIRGRRDFCYAIYDAKNHQNRLAEQWMEDHFEEALQEHQLEVWYQPKYTPVTGKITGAEALVRWRTSDGRVISPGAFIPLFERNGMIARLDEYMFREVCFTQKEWAANGKAIRPVSVNISRTSLYYSGIFDRYLSIVRDSGIDIHMVQLEVTEGTMMDSKEMEALIRQFRKEGFHILVDDFGAGYSSLSTLNLNCFDTIKLDKRLIDCIGDANGETLLYYVTRLAQSLGLTITAEGVEQENQVYFLAQLRCNDIQGFFYSAAIPSKEYEKTLPNRP